MDNDVAIKLERVSKKYCKNIKDSMVYGMMDIGRNLVGLKSCADQLRKNEFWAVEDVSFEIKRGESFGLIGPNGSGKTTLLKMLNGIFWPDKGKITVNGRVGALIAVGAGFHPLLTGRENIYINGAILGMSKKEVDEKFDPIVEFADIGDFLDTPVKHYSSGMYVRLGFSIAVHCDPEILLVDEILAVGDRNFQIKCFQRMHELKKNDGVTIILVSHNEYTIREYTQRSLVVDHGKMLFLGDTEDAISFYLNSLIKQKKMKNSAELSTTADNPIIQSISFLNSDGQIVNSIRTGERLIIELTYNTKRKIKKPIFGLNLSNSEGVFAVGFWNSMENVQFSDIEGSGEVRITVDPCDLPFDRYACSVVVCEEEESNVIEWKQIPQRLTIERPNHVRGYYKFRQNWELTHNERHT